MAATTITGGPSEAAVEAAIRPFAVDRVTQSYVAAALAAAHDPALGLDRSVRLGDVVEWIQQHSAAGSAAQQRAVTSLANRIAREFGEAAQGEGTVE